MESEDGETCKIIKKRIHLFHIDEKKNLLLDCAKNGHIQSCKYLLSQGTEINLLNSSLQTILIISIKNKHFSNAKEFIELGVDIHQVDKRGQNAIHWCAIKNNLEILQILFNNGAKLHEKTYEGANAKTLALIRKNYEIVDFLHSKGESLKNITCKLETFSSISPLQIFASESLRQLKYVIKDGVNLNEKNVYPALHLALIAEKFESFRYLIKKGANINIKDEYGWNSMNLCINRNLIDPFLFLIKKGVNLFQIDNLGKTPLHLAVVSARLVIIKLIIIIALEYNSDFMTDHINNINNNEENNHNNNNNDNNKNNNNINNNNNNNNNRDKVIKNWKNAFVMTINYRSQLNEIKDIYGKRPIECNSGVEVDQTTLDGEPDQHEITTRNNIKLLLS